MTQSSFSSRSVILLIACATALAAISVLLHARGSDAPTGPQFAAHSRSISAIGHAGFYDLLHRLGRPVSRSTGNVPAEVRASGTFVVAEPDLRRLSERGRGTGAARMLLVLPKWRGTPDENRPSWVSEVEPVPLYAARQVLTFFTEGRGVVLRRRIDEVSYGAGIAALQPWQTNAIGITPALPDVVQLIQSGEITPLVGNSEGMLLGEIEIAGRKIWVLSDPDIMSNHGIVNGDNAAFMLATIDMLRSWNNSSPDAAIVFDGVVHGFRERQESPFSLLFGFPFVIVTILTCIAAVLLALSGMSRFGAPLVSKPALDFGKANLISNGARLLDYAGHHAEVLVRYMGMTLNSVESALRAPAGHGDNMATSEWLDRVGRSRGVRVSCVDFFRIYHDCQALLDSGVSAKKTTKDEPSLPDLNSLFKNAKKIYDWKQEILKGEGVTHGSSNGPSIRQHNSKRH